MTVVVMHHAAGETPAAVIRVLAGAGLASRAVPLADGADPTADLGGVEGLILLGGSGSAGAGGGVDGGTGGGAGLVRAALAAEVPVLAPGTGTRLLVRAAGPATGTSSRPTAPGSRWPAPA
ncbi:hypothetical protein [Streptomyces sp. NPDC059389]|uniref:hypothetical protein n=1 Tax=Streptomyces sp. NPDC059389 TaxID=3346818 RepID=UPI0036C6C214